MLRVEDMDVLGLCPETRYTRQPSKASQVLRAIRDDAEQGVALDIAAESDANAACRIVAAATRQSRQRAYALAHRVYRRSGYARNEGTGLCLSPFDAIDQTLTLLAENADGQATATLSLVFDSDEGLPCDEIYRPEVDALRARGCRLAEVTRLAIEEPCADAKSLLLRMFNYCYIFSRFIRGCTDLVIEVNPSHVKYYRRLLLFTQVGPERRCSRVQGAPAVLLRLNLAEIEAAVKGSGFTEGRDSSGNRLHAYPYSEAEEAAIAESLARQHRPMSAEEARYFGLQRQS